MLRFLLLAALASFACGPAPVGSNAAPAPAATQPSPPAPEPEVAEPQPQQPTAAAAVALVAIDDPGLEARFAEAPDPPAVRMRVARSVANQVIDDERWLEAHDTGRLDARPEGAPAAIDGLPFAFALATDPPLAAYGDAYRIRCLWVARADGPPTLLDARTLQANEMEVTHAWRQGDTIYVTRAHRGYASTTDGKNAYLLAVGASDGAVLWQTEPLTSNAQRFAMEGRVIYTGYGFTDEDDDVYAVDRLTGHRLARVRLRKGPSYLALEGDALHVRTYDRDVTVRVQLD